MIGVMAEVRDRHQVVLTELNLGGGHAVPYLSGDPELNLRSLGVQASTPHWNPLVPSTNSLARRS